MTAPTTYDPPRRITGWHIHATCPTCGHTLAHEAHGQPTDAGTTSRAIARCIGCNRRWKAELRLTDATQDLGAKAFHNPECACPPCAHRRSRNTSNA